MVVVAARLLLGSCIGSMLEFYGVSDVGDLRVCSRLALPLGTSDPGGPGWGCPWWCYDFRRRRRLPSVVRVLHARVLYVVSLPCDALQLLLVAHMLTCIMASSQPCMTFRPHLRRRYCHGVAWSLMRSITPAVLPAGLSLPPSCPIDSTLWSLCLGRDGISCQNCLRGFSE